MHRLLMERGEIIATLIRVKKSDETGSAFRPGREAEMMRRLAARHGGLLPLDTAEGIWRVIIGTFTYVQKAYGVHADISGGDAPMRDSARFHFGFTVPFLTHGSAAEVIAAVAASAGDLGMFRSDQGAQAGAWWTALAEPSAPKIIARLPFIERPDHPAGTPVFVVAKPLADAAARERVLICAHARALARGRSGDPCRARRGGHFERRHAERVEPSHRRTGLALRPKEVATALSAAGRRSPDASEAGSHAERFAFQPQAEKK